MEKLEFSLRLILESRFIFLESNITSLSAFLHLSNRCQFCTGGYSLPDASVKSRNTLSVLPAKYSLLRRRCCTVFLHLRTTFLLQFLFLIQRCLYLLYLGLLQFRTISFLLQ